jgi:predicted ArsR family transcriptional regulator
MSKRCPNSTGWKGEPGGIGHRAAADFNEKRPTRLEEALAALAAIGSGTAVQVAERVGRHWLHVARRLSDLCARGLACKTDAKGRSAFGSDATVYRLLTPEERSLFLARKAVTDEKGEANG